jgi:hypothetical protein
MFAVREVDAGGRADADAALAQPFGPLRAIALTHLGRRHLAELAVGDRTQEEALTLGSLVPDGEHLARVFQRLLERHRHDQPTGRYRPLTMRQWLPGGSGRSSAWMVSLRWSWPSRGTRISRSISMRCATAPGADHPARVGATMRLGGDRGADARAQLVDARLLGGLERRVPRDVGERADLELGEGVHARPRVAIRGIGGGVGLVVEVQWRIVRGDALEALEVRVQDLHAVVVRGDEDAARRDGHRRRDLEDAVAAEPRLLDALVLERAAQAIDERRRVLAHRALELRLLSRRQCDGGAAQLHDAIYLTAGRNGVASRPAHASA